MDARSRLITDMEASARLTREEADQEQAKLKGLLSAMDGVMRGMRGASAMEHERLHHEQSRLSTGQDALAAQAQAQREAAATAEAHLRARVRQGDTDRGRRDDVLDAKSAALIEAEAALNIRDVEWVRETAKSKSGLEQRAKSLDSKEAALRALQMKIEEEGRALDGKVQEVRSAMNRAAAREDAVESRERRVAEEQQRLLVMHAELQAASRAMSLRSSELDRATSESDRLALHGEAAAAELASHRAGLLEARAAAHELMHRTEHEKLRLLKDRTDVLKAKAALHRHATSTAVQLREPQAQHYAASNALTQAQAPFRPAP
ncbi:hypothetical protein M885DRAFT_333019 [Pelagophyceae sp. CCMP2097]|nr:hypothetical protein M885DRAFT_333019 [Pelagophyceae sp. CCMP2097]